MKKITLIVIAIAFILGSCTMEKRHFLSGYNIQWKGGKIKQNKNLHQTAPYNLTNETVAVNKSIPGANEKRNNLIIPAPVNNNESSNLIAATDSKQIIISDNLKTIIAKSNVPIASIKAKNALENCDIIVLKDGSEIRAKIIEIGSTEIKYKKCDYLDGPTFSIKKSDVFMIKYPNGTKDVFTSNNSSPSNNVRDKSQNNTSIETGNDTSFSGMAIASFACSLFGLLLFLITGWPFLLGTLSVIFGAIALGKTGPGKKKGKGFAIAGLSVGILDILLFWLLVVALATMISVI